MDPEVHRHRVLVADEEELVRALIARCLKPHEVHLLSTGSAVLERLDTGATYDVILLDMHIGNAIDVFNAIRERDPSLVRRLVFMTGDTTSRAASAFLLDSGVQRLDKPFGAADVRAVVRRVVSLVCALDQTV